MRSRSVPVGAVRTWFSPFRRGLCTASLLVGAALLVAPSAAEPTEPRSARVLPTAAAGMAGRAQTPPGTLRWPRPTLSNPITLTIPTRGQEEFRLAAGQDYRLQFQDGLRYGPVRIYGGRNVVLVGGEHIIDDTVYDRFEDHRLFELRDQTGTIHIEGYYGHGPGATEGFNTWLPSAVFQLQNSRVEIKRMHADASPEHPDILKTWSGPKELRVWNFSGASDWNGFLFMRDVGGVYPRRVVLDRVNMWPQPNPAWGGQGYGTSYLWMLSALTEFRLGTVWVETGYHRKDGRKGLKDSLGYRDPDLTAPLWSWREFRASGRPYRPGHFGQPANTGRSRTTKQGDSIVFLRPLRDNIWNLRRSGRGKIFQGRPSAGDFAPAGAVGRGYVAAAGM